MIIPDPGAREAGLTLIEMLVVLVIVAVMAGAVALGMGSATGRTTEAEARRLAARLELAGDEAMVTGRTIGFQHDQGSYRFVEWQGGQWRPDPTPALEPHALAFGLALEGDGGGRQVVVIGADGGGTPLALRLVAGKGAAWGVAFDGVQAEARAGG